MSNITPELMLHPFRVANAITVGICAGSMLGFMFTYSMLTGGDVVSYFINDLTRGQRS